MEAIGVCVFIVIGLLGLFTAGGWIIPLVIGSVWRRDNRPGARTWMVLASVWGGVALLVAAGIVAIACLAMRGSGSRVQDYSGTEEFDPAKCTGSLGTVSISFCGDASLVASCGSDKQIRFTATNGAFAMPAGQWQVHRYQATAIDKAGQKWTADVECDDTAELLDVKPGLVQNLNGGPPFKASIEVSSSPLSDAITMVPAYVDSRNNKSAISCEKQTAPRFQVIDAGGKVVWSGDFQYG